MAKEASLGATAKATASMASCIFNAVNILKTIDSKAGSLNDDTAVDEYAKIELDSELPRRKRARVFSDVATISRVHVK